MSDHDYVAGIDIGLDGAIVLLRAGDIYRHWNMPTMQVKQGSAAREYDEGALGMLLDELDEYRAFVIYERAMSFSKGGAALTKLHGCQGFIRGYLARANVPAVSEHPATWKSAMRVGALKSSSVQEASRLFPAHRALFQPKRGERTKPQAEGIAEAALLATYARQRRHS